MILHELKTKMMNDLIEMEGHRAYTMQDLDRIQKETSIVKNICRINSYHGESDYEHEHHENKDKLMRRLGEMMDESDPNEREHLKRWMRELERA